MPLHSEIIVEINVPPLNRVMTPEVLEDNPADPARPLLRIRTIYGSLAFNGEPDELMAFGEAITESVFSWVTSNVPHSDMEKSLINSGQRERPDNGSSSNSSE